MLTLPKCPICEHVAVAEQVDAADRYEAGPDEDMRKEEAEDEIQEQAAPEGDGTAVDAARTGAL